MPTLDDLLAQTMLFTAARGLGDTPVEFDRAFAVPRPTFKNKDLDAASIRRRSVWQWKHEPVAPAAWREVNCWSRGMNMNYSMPVPVLDALVWQHAIVERFDGDEITLPLAPEFVVGKWRIVHGRIKTGASSLWPLDARTDASMVAVFAFKLDEGEIKPLTRAEIDDLGDDLMPERGFGRFSFPADGKTKAFACVGPVRYVLAVELVLCKEHDDYAPFGLVGMCRVHPHALFWSNEPLKRFEATLSVQRPSKAMTHGDPTMQEKIHALIVTDCNNPPTLPGKPPDPIADVLYDYYVTDAFKTFEGRTVKTSSDHPRQQPSEVCLVDPRFIRHRPIEGGVTRSAGTAPWHDTPDKEPRQGQFDNIHLAPRMRTHFDTAIASHDGVKIVPVSLDNIVMMFVCMHDCLHMHARWGAHADEPFTRGWSGGRPHAKAGAPAVPENQVVFAKFPKSHVLEYRAVAESVQAGALQVLCHHGFGYAIDEWPEGEATFWRTTMRTIVELIAEYRVEPFNKEMPFDWPTFYWRFRFGGKKGARPVERLDFGSDIERVMR